MIYHRTVDRFPYIVNQGVWGGLSTTIIQSATMPRNPQVGDLAIMCMNGANANVSSYPSGWAIFPSTGNYSNPLCNVMYKICDGSELSMNIIMSSNVTAQTYGFIIRGAAKSPIGNAGGATSGAASQASLTTATIDVSGGSIAFVWNSGTGAVTSVSNGFTMLYETDNDKGSLFYKYFQTDETGVNTTIVNTIGDRHRNNIFEIKLAG